MPATHFDSNYNVGDNVYIFFDDGAAGQVALTAIGFREGFNPLAFIPDDDFIYTTNKLASDNITYLKRPQKFCFATKNNMSTYVLSLP